MPDTAVVDRSDWEPIEVVRALARRNGLPLTDKQLHTAQQRGAIPSPDQILLGRKGSRVVYRPGTAQQLARYCVLLDEGVTIDEAIWQLWWESFPIDEQIIRTHLAREHELFRRVIKWQQQLTSSSASERREIEDQLLDTSLTRRRPSAFATLIAHSGERYPDLFKVLMAVSTGEFVRLSSADAQALSQTLGGTVVTKDAVFGGGEPRITDSILRRLSAILLEALTTDVADLAWDKLTKAKDEARLLESLAPALAAAVASGGEQKVAELSSVLLENLGAIRPGILLIWRAAREQEEVSRWYASIVAALQPLREAAQSVTTALTQLGPPLPSERDDSKG